MNDVREQGTKKRKQGKRKVLCEEVAEKRQREYNVYIYIYI